MENLTHTFVGAALAECGLKRVTPLATTTLLIAANIPDIDVVSGFFGAAAYLDWHRGITHSLFGFPIVAIVLAVLVYFLSGRRASLPRLTALSLIGTATHPLLDFTNSYGWRPFLPWDSSWHFIDIAFVADPWIWLGLGGALFLVKSESRRQQLSWLLLAAAASLVIMTSPLGWEIRAAWVTGLILIFAMKMTMNLDERRRLLLNRVALVGLVFYLGGLSLLHSVAIFRAAEVAQTAIAANEQVVQLNALPVEANPFKWRLVIETERAFHVGSLAIVSGEPVLTRIEREQGDAEAIEAAKTTETGSRFLRFARFPVFRSIESGGDRAIEIQDIRFADVTSRFKVTLRGETMEKTE